MNTLKTYQTLAERWRWPVDITPYETTPDLSTAEADALDALFAHFATGQQRWLPDTARALDRLLTPIHATMDRIEVEPRTRRQTINMLFRGMYRRRLSYWGWQWSDWVDVIRDRSLSRPRSAGQTLMLLAYLLRRFNHFHDLGVFRQLVLARRIFGNELMTSAIQLILDELLQWGYGRGESNRHDVANVVCELMIANYSPRFDALNTQILEEVSRSYLPEYLKRPAVRVSRALVDLGFIQKPLPPLPNPGHTITRGLLDDIAPEWVRWAQRWHDTSPLIPKTRKSFYYHLLKVGRWLFSAHPEVVSPDQWTRELVAEYVAAVDRMVIGDFNAPYTAQPETRGKPYCAQTKLSHLSAVAGFFRDCQEWQWITRHFSPERCFRLSHLLRSQARPSPRIIADEWWAKLLWAGLNLVPEDLQYSTYTTEEFSGLYPFAMVHAITLVWLFAGLRVNEICRLRVGCIRWNPAVPDEVCLLDVPVNKTSGAFTKPVARLVGAAVTAWEQVRPDQPFALDPKTGEMVPFLFCYRGKRIGHAYVNQSLIPVLCRKAGIPESDTRGPITSHRARSTIASQLANAKSPMSLLELQQWLGHHSPQATQHYVSITPARLTRSYTDAGYLDRNIRTIQVLIDQDTVKTGAAAHGEPWRFYDLGHGYCTYDFFDQCPHRMACAKCAFYRPKDSTAVQLLEAKTNLLRMQQEIPLTDDEQAAVEDGLAAIAKLCDQLIDVPTPAGQTPRQLGRPALPTFIPLEAIDTGGSKAG